MTRRSRKSVGAALCWALAYVALSAALKPGWLGEAALLALFLIGAGVLWNWDSIAASWREDRARKQRG